MKAVTMKTIVSRLNDENELVCDAEVIKRLCSGILRDAERLLTIRALLNAVVSLDRVGPRVTPEQFTWLGECGGWLCGAKMPSDQTIRNFVNGTNPNQPEVLAAYLYGLSVLKRFEHPVFTDVIVQALVRYCEPLAIFEQVLNRSPAGEVKLGVAEVARMGRQFYHVMHHGSGVVPPAAFDRILASKLVGGIMPATNDEDLGRKQCHLTAIRLGVSGRVYVVSQVSVALVEVGPPEAVEERFLYLRTTMAASGEEARIASHGFMLPAPTHTYLAQYHLGGQGLNISALLNSDLHDPHCARCRGMILAVDREGNEGALCSKLVLIRANRPHKLVGNFERPTLKRKLKEDGVEVSCEDIVSYLHDIGGVSIRVPGDPMPGYPGQLATWREVSGFAREDAAIATIDGLRGEELSLIGELQRPLRTE
jgi:hypothetical protein